MEAPRILIIDDEEDLCDLLATVLAESGYEVKTAKTGRTALDFIYSDWRPHVILLDMNLPDMDGNAIMSKVYADRNTAAIPVIVFSGYPLDNLSTPAFAALPKSPLHLAKPFGIALLIDMIQHAIEMQAPVRPVPLAQH